MTENHALVSGVTPGKDQAVRNGMPELRPYRYRGGRGLVHGQACPCCGGQVRQQAGSLLGICRNCYATVELEAP